MSVSVSLVFHINPYAQSTLDNSFFDEGEDSLCNPVRASTSSRQIASKTELLMTMIWCCQNKHKLRSKFEACILSCAIVYELLDPSSIKLYSPWCACCGLCLCYLLLWNRVRLSWISPCLTSLSERLSVCLFVCSSVCLSVFESYKDGLSRSSLCCGLAHGC